MALVFGTVVAAVKHESIQGCCLLVGQRLEADGQLSGEPIVVADWLGAGSGSLVMVSMDGDIAREKLGNTTPVRMVVAGIVDEPSRPKATKRSAR